MADQTDERDGLGPGQGWHNVTQQGVPPAAGAANNKGFWSVRPSHHVRLESRIKELKGYCEEDGVTLRARSEYDFWTFIESPQLSLSSSKFDVVATDDGNLRAVYDELGVHIGVEFFGDQNCEYVIWSSEKPPTGARATVTHTLELIDSLLHQ